MRVERIREYYDGLREMDRMDECRIFRMVLMAGAGMAWKWSWTAMDDGGGCARSGKPWCICR